MLTTDKARRLGRFRVLRELLQSDPDSLLPVFAGCVVSYTQYDFMSDEVEFVAFNAAFDLSLNGELAPEYVAEVTTDGDGITSVHWKRAA